MTKSNITSSNYINYTTFGGVIYDFDFNTEYIGKSKANEGSSIARRIASDWKFDNTCSVHAENRDRQLNYKKEQKTEHKIHIRN